MDRTESVLNAVPSLLPVDSFLNKVFSGSLGLMVKTMIKDEKLSDEDIDELVNILKNS